jgi:hypothetical protein
MFHAHFDNCLVLCHQVLFTATLSWRRRFEPIMVLRYGSLEYQHQDLRLNIELSLFGKRLHHGKSSRSLRGSQQERTQLGLSLN